MNVGMFGFPAFEQIVDFVEVGEAFELTPMRWRIYHEELTLWMCTHQRIEECEALGIFVVAQVTLQVFHQVAFFDGDGELYIVCFGLQFLESIDLLDAAVDKVLEDFRLWREVREIAAFGDDFLVACVFLEVVAQVIKVRSEVAESGNSVLPFEALVFVHEFAHTIVVEVGDEGGGVDGVRGFVDKGSVIEFDDNGRGHDNVRCPCLRR